MTPSNFEPMLVRRKEACQLLSVGTTKLHDLINDGRLEVVKAGRRTLITMSSIRAMAKAA